MNTYVANVHTCSLDDIVYDNPFSYTAYGRDSQDTQPIPHPMGEVTTLMIDPRSPEKRMDLAVVADWGIMINNPNNLVDIMSSLKK